MCEASASVPVHRRTVAVAGIAYHVRDVGDAAPGHRRSDRVAGLILPGTRLLANGTYETIACIAVATYVMLVDVPIETQEEYGLGPTVSGMFIPAKDNDERHDVVELASGAYVPFAKFAGVETRCTLKAEEAANSGRTRREAPTEEPMRMSA